MENSTKKSAKMTTALQFRQLVACMEEFPHLATGTPQFGSSKAAMECTWEKVASKVNAYGPPSRSGNEWKKVWTDLKCRLKKKIADNNRSLNETGGGPCRVSNLTELEVDIDRICYISAAAAPSGKVYGFPKNVAASSAKKQNVFGVTPPRRSQNVAVVTPTSSSKATKVIEDADSFPQQWLVCNEKSDSVPTTSKNNNNINNQQHQTYRMSTSIPKIVSSERKRKHCNNEAVSEGQERLKILRQQCEIQSGTLEAIRTQAESTKECTAAVKECAASAVECTEAIKNLAATFKALSDSMKLIANCMVDILWHISDKEVP